jgi:hypothetical protein
MLRGVGCYAVFVFCKLHFILHHMIYYAMQKSAQQRNSVTGLSIKRQKNDKHDTARRCRF